MAGKANIVAKYHAYMIDPATKKGGKLCCNHSAHSLQNAQEEDAMEFVHASMPAQTFAVGAMQSLLQVHILDMCRRRLLGIQ